MPLNYTPWGNIDWITNKLIGIEKWDFLGCISTEERSLGAWLWLKKNKRIRHYEMWKISDNQLSPYFSLSENEYKKRIQIFNENGGQEYKDFHLLDSDVYASEQFNSFISTTDGNIIIDISTMPQRWFFPIIRDCLQDTKLNNLIILYTLPKSYSKKQGEDPLAWRYFPSFGELTEREKYEKYFIISAGFQPLSLPESISQYGKTNVYILFPFPSFINGYPHVWDFIRAVESDCGIIEKNKICYVSGLNLPVIYKSISDIIKLEKNREPVFLPYGPKPISLAFSILASQLHFPVGYTQPMYYNPYYSRGIETIENGTPKTMSYLLIINGRSLYTPPKVKY